MIDKKPAPAAAAPVASNFQSPAPKPPGILLTPGTGTTRRKRVSFGHDVKAGANHPTDDDSGNALFNSANKDKQSRPKSKLQQALENSRSKSKKSAEPTNPRPETKDPVEDVWEEVSDAEDRDPDVTVDLNIPQSQSGKYWKSCFESYHADAKAEMEKLVKYKELAKSYAKMKDSEALDLQQKLQEERDRVQQMEKKVAELANQIRTSREKGTEVGGRKDNEMMVELAKQTALAMDYREKLDELEDLLDHSGQESEASKMRRVGKHVTSPRTQKTLIETQRELRRARAQVKELGDLKAEVSRLKAELSAEKQKSGKLAEENRKLAGDLSRSGAKVVDLEKELDESRSEARQKERELRTLKSEHAQLKENAKSRFSEAEQVRQKKNEAISSLKDEIRSLKADMGRDADRETRLRGDRENLRKRYSQLANNPTLELDEGNTTAKLDGYDIGRRRSMSNGLSLPRLSYNIHLDTEARHKENTPTHKDEALPTPRTLRERKRPEIGTSSSSSALSERDNLQETRRETATAHNRHSYPSVAEPQHYEKPEKPVGDLRRRDSRGSIRRKAEMRPSLVDDEARGIDLVQGRFARLGGPTTDVNTSVAWDINTSKTTLPPERRAAAIARLQQRKAEKARSLGRDKENMPMV
jgi:myosin heavy subunit